MEYLFSAWSEVFTRLKSAEHIILLSDFDGTLTPIVARPELANLPERTKGLLQEVMNREKYTVGIISGRALDELKGRVGLKGIFYAGNHGWEIEGPGLSFVNPQADGIKPILCDLHQVLTTALGATKGVFVENKGLSLSVHYRLAEEGQSAAVRDIFQRLTAGRAGKIQTTSGKKVYEVRPAIPWDKGKVIDLLIEKSGRKGDVLPIFLGDDLTDEDGFKAVKKYSGISIFVGEEGGKSQASYFLRSPTEVEEFLERLP